MHGGDHGQDRDRKKQNRKNASHGLAFLDLAPGFGIGDVFILGKYQEGLAEGFVDFFYKRSLFHIGPNIDLIIQIVADKVPEDGGDDIRQHLRGNVGKSVGVEIRHELGLIGNADHEFGCFNKTLDSSCNGQGFVRKCQAIADRNVVRFGILIREPDAVFALGIVRFTVHEVNTGYVDVFADGNGNDIGTVFYPRIDGQKTGGIPHAVDGADRLKILLREPFFREDTVIGKAGFIENEIHIFFQAVPFHVKADKYADAQGDHNDHRDELGFVTQECAEQFSFQHFTSPPPPRSEDSPVLHRKRFCRSLRGLQDPPFWQYSGCVLR